MRLSDVISGLHRLPRTVLEELHARTGALLAGAEDTSELATIYQAVEGALRQQGDRPPPLGVIMRHRRSHEFRKGAEALTRYLDKNLKGLTRPERVRAIQLFVTMVTRRLQRDGVPLGIFTLGAGLGRVASIVDDQFPGYVESGLLPAIVKGAAAWR